MPKPNPFIAKAQARKNRQRQRAQRNHAELVKLFRRFTDDDDPATRERMRQRVEEARKVAEHYD